jgi:hypothetical protein
MRRVEVRVPRIHAKAVLTGVRRPPGRSWVAGPALEVVEKYKETLKKYPNPPAGNVTKF